MIKILINYAFFNISENINYCMIEPTGNVVMNRDKDIFSYRVQKELNGIL